MVVGDGGVRGGLRGSELVPLAIARAFRTALQPIPDSGRQLPPRTHQGTDGRAHLA